MLKNMNFDPTCKIINDVQTKFCNKFEKFKPELPNAVFGSRIDPLVCQIAGEGPTVCRVQKYPVRARVT